MILHHTFLKWKKFPLLLLILPFAFSLALAGDPIEVSKNFSLFTSKNMEGFLKPAFTSLEESLNSNAYYKAVIPDYWTISLDLAVMGMVIPESQKTFNAQRPENFANPAYSNTAELRGNDVVIDNTGSNDQPTIYGGRSTAVFSVPQNHNYPAEYAKTVTYKEGYDIGFMSGLPVIQLAAGFPTRTQLRLRFLTAPVQDESTTYFGILVNQQVNQFFGLFDTDPLMGLAVNAGFHNISRTGIDIQSWSAGVNFSKGWDFGVTLYAGLQYEGLSGNIKMVKEDPLYGDNMNSPYKEVRDAADLEFKAESFTSFRLLGGAAYRIGFFEIHGDAAWASQPLLNVGVSFWFASWGKALDIGPTEKE